MWETLLALEVPGSNEKTLVFASMIHACASGCKCVMTVKLTKFFQISTYKIQILSIEPSKTFRNDSHFYMK